MGEGEPPQAEGTPLLSPDCGVGSFGQGALSGFGHAPSEEASVGDSRGQPSLMSAAADWDRFAGGESVAIRLCSVSLWLRTRSESLESAEVARCGTWDDALATDRAAA